MLSPFTITYTPAYDIIEVFDNEMDNEAFINIYSAW